MTISEQKLNLKNVLLYALFFKYDPSLFAELARFQSLSKGVYDIYIQGVPRVNAHTWRECSLCHSEQKMKNKNFFFRP